MNPGFNIGRFRFASSAVSVEGRPPVDEWVDPLQFALWCQKASPWWIGDLLHAGDARFGESFYQACEGMVSADQLQRYVSVARRVPAENRNPNLSWSTHAVVARFPAAEQPTWLDRAERQGWTSEDLRRRVRGLSGSRRKT